MVNDHGPIVFGDPARIARIWAPVDPAEPSNPLQLGNRTTISDDDPLALLNESRLTEQAPGCREAAYAWHTGATDKLRDKDAAEILALLKQWVQGGMRTYNFEIEWYLWYKGTWLRVARVC